MTERWVVNASPLIVLAKVGQTRLLTDIASEIAIPQAVAQEIAAGPGDDPARIWLNQQEQLVVDVPIQLPELWAWDLGAGETAVMAYALANTGWTAVIDDNAARKCAHSFNIRVKGTLAVIIQAKQRGLIDSAAAILRQMQQHGYRIHEAIVRDALARTVGEAW